MSSVDLQYPVGRFSPPAEMDTAARSLAISVIAETPARLRAAVVGLRDAQLDAPYRPGGWTVRQVVHHVPDSHLNAYVRFKLALTEAHPTIKPYDQDAWARMADSRGPIEPSLGLLDLLHQRWVIVLNGMIDPEFARTLHHPEEGTLTLGTVLALYAWHGPHHIAHITGLRSRMGW